MSNGEDPSEDGCCVENTAECNACREKVTLLEYCNFINPLADGCEEVLEPDGSDCCKYDFASCRACRADKSIEEFCVIEPDT